MASICISRLNSSRASLINSSSVVLSSWTAASPTTNPRTATRPGATRDGNFVLIHVAAAKLRRSLFGTRNPKPSKAMRDLIRGEEEHDQDRRGIRDLSQIPGQLGCRIFKKSGANLRGTCEYKMFRLEQLTADLHDPVLFVSADSIRLAVHDFCCACNYVRESIGQRLHSICKRTKQSSLRAGFVVLLNASDQASITFLVTEKSG